MQRMVGQNIDSKYRLILIAAERAEQLLNGARPKMEHPSIKVARSAMEEVLEGLVAWDYGPTPEPVVEESEEGASSDNGDEVESNLGA